MRKRLIVGAALGDCVHVGGLVGFLRLAEEEGYETICLGPAVSIERLLGAVTETDPEIIAISFRLTPESGRELLVELQKQVRAHGHGHRRFIFGGTDPVAVIAQKLGLFDAVFGGSTDVQVVLNYLRGKGAGEQRPEDYPQTLIERIRWKHPYPVLRHHYGQPSVADTVRGVSRIAAARCLDVISLGTDQNAQESFFRPEEMDPLQHGAGGVPVRSAADLYELAAAARRGNSPLLRCYSGTRDVMRWAEMLHETINNAWCAVPLYWYSVLDGRSPRPLRESIPEAQRLMRWNGQRGVPVEMNESHHWSLRDAPDVVAVAAAYLAAYNARAAGVGDYIAQFMFNTPPATSPAMDLAKMLAKLELVEELRGPDFRIWREVRAGLTSYPADFGRAKGHLAASVFLQMQLRPHILHVVGYPEADHAADADEVIESCRIAEGAIHDALLGTPDMTADPKVQRRKAELVAEARILLEAIANLAAPGVSDPLTDADTLARAAEVGLMDAPHLWGNAAACGQVKTHFIGGACLAVDDRTPRALSERERIARVLAQAEGLQTGGGRPGDG